VATLEAECGSGCTFWFYVAKDLHHSNHVRVFERAFDTHCVEVCERRLIEKLRIHHAACCEMIDDKVEELDRISS
jgi:hypothetical protein